MCSSHARRAVGHGGFALHEAVRGRVIGVSDPHVVQFPPNQPCATHDARGAGAQNADHLAEKCLKCTDIGEVVCTLGESVAVIACCLHMNPILRVVTRYVARKPLNMHVGGAAHARTSGLPCELAAYVHTCKLVCIAETAH